MLLVKPGCLSNSFILIHNRPSLYLQLARKMESPLTDQTCYTTHKVATALRRHITLENSLPIYKPFFKDPTYKILGSSAIGYAINLPSLDSFSWELVKQANKSIALGASNRRGLNTSYGFFQTASMVEDNRSFFELGLGKPKADTVQFGTCKDTRIFIRRQIVEHSRPLFFTRRFSFGSRIPVECHIHQGRLELGIQLLC